MTKIEHEFPSSSFTRTTEFDKKDIKVDNNPDNVSEFEAFCSDEDEGGEFQRLSLDSGLGMEGEEEDKEGESGNEANSDYDNSGEILEKRKLQSILKTNPQVFVVRSEKKGRKKSVKGHSPNESHSHPQRKSVEFLLPDGVKIPERRPVHKKKNSRIHFTIHRARTTLGHLKLKITGQNSGVPPLPSVHSSQTLKQNQKKHQQQGKPKASPVFVCRSGIKLGKERSTNGEKTKEGDLKEEEEEKNVVETNSLVLGSVLVSEDEDWESGRDEEEDEKQDLLPEENKNNDDENGKGQEEEDFPHMSRRKALSYHLRKINLQQQQNHTRKRKKVKTCIPFITKN